MKFVTLFLKTENVHLLKDVGMIPYLLNKHHGYDSSIVSFRNEHEYPYLEKEVKGLKLNFIPHRFPGKILDGICYLCGHAKEIDVLNVYHLNLSSFFWLLAYRFFRKKTGRSYLKLDMNPIGLTTALAHNPVGMIKRATIRLADVVSVETRRMQSVLNEHFPNKVLYLPNGCFIPESSKTGETEKQNVILTVGNLGTREKATDTLLEAFARADLGPDWRLKLVGPVAKDFEAFQTSFFEKHPQLSENVEFTGAIRDKERLNQLYAESKIFAFPSRSESYGIAMIEAISNGDFIVTTKGVPLGYDIYQEGRFGTIVEIDDVEELSQAFQALAGGEIDWQKKAQEIRDFTRQNFAWEPILERLVQTLEK